MAVSLVDLVWRLEGDIPVRDGVPSRMQIEACVAAAVRDYSRRRPMTRSVLLSIAAGTAAYDLPSDFLRVISFQPLFAIEGVLHTESGLVAPYSLPAESTSIAGLTLTIYPTPGYTLDRRLLYAAGHVLDADGAYPDMGEEDADILLNFAAAMALRVLSQTAAAAGELVEYAIGDERVKRRSLSDALRDQARERESAYLDAVHQANVPYGLRGDLGLPAP